MQSKPIKKTASFQELQPLFSPPPPPPTHKRLSMTDGSDNFQLHILQFCTYTYHLCCTLTTIVLFRSLCLVLKLVFVYMLLFLFAFICLCLLNLYELLDRFSLFFQHNNNKDPSVCLSVCMIICHFCSFFCIYSALSTRS